jgi:hypothetical protein
MERGQYICRDCRRRFAWGYGFTEKPPEVKLEDLKPAICPQCAGLEFRNPLEILTGRKVH